MPIYANAIAVPAASTTQDQLFSEPGNPLQAPSVLQVYAITDDTVSGEVRVNFQIDSELVLTAAPVPASPGTGQGPRDPEDRVLTNQAAAMGQRLILTFANANGTTAQSVRYRVEVTPLTA